MHRTALGGATKGAGEEEAMNKFPKIGTAKLSVEDVNSKGSMSATRDATSKSRPMTTGQVEQNASVALKLCDYVPSPTLHHCL
jgi:hypothetical protein